jgi:hypothetical protein
MNCCDANGNCTQGRDCPVRIERAEQGIPLSRKENALIYATMICGLMAYVLAIVLVVESVL